MSLIPFTPTANATPPFQADVVLDGQPYNLQVYWLYQGQRWYMRLIDGNGNTTWNGAFIASPDGFDMPLAAGIFTNSTIVFRESTNNIEVLP